MVITNERLNELSLHKRELMIALDKKEITENEFNRRMNLIHDEMRVIHNEINGKMASKQKNIFQFK